MYFYFEGCVSANEYHLSVNGQNQNGLQHTDKVGIALAFDRTHEGFSPFGEEYIGVSKGRTKDATSDAHKYGWEHRDNIDGYEVLRSEFGFEQPEIIFVLKAMKGGVEQVRGKGGGHAAEEHLPGELILPKGRYLLHGEQ